MGFHFLNFPFWAVHEMMTSRSTEERIQLMGNSTRSMEVPQHAFLSATDVARKQLQQQLQRQQQQHQQQQHAQQQHIHCSW